MLFTLTCAVYTSAFSPRQLAAGVGSDLLLVSLGTSGLSETHPQNSDLFRSVIGLHFFAPFRQWYMYICRLIGFDNGEER